MRTWIVLLAVLLVGMGDAAAQEVELSRKERRSLDSLSLAVIKKFGEEGYYNMAKKEKPVIVLKRYDSKIRYDGREYYEVSY